MVYTLDDLYTIFRQAGNKVECLRNFQAMNLPYKINWDNLIKVWLNSGD